MDRNEILISLCQKLIQIPSLSGQEQQVASLLKLTMETFHFDEVTIDRYGSVLGTLRGKKPGKSVLLDGHIDTVDISDASRWTHDPYGAEIVDGKIYGRGTSDMKGSVAAMLLSAAFFAEDTQKDFAGTIYVSCTVHEECFEGIAAREITKHIKPDYVIIGEATTNTLKIGQRGRAEIVVETEGKTCHSSNPSKGINAIQHMMALIQRINTIQPNEQSVLGKGIMELTDIISSPYPGASVVPGLCRVTYDRRTLVGETEQSVLAPVKAVIEEVKKIIPELKARTYLSEGSETCWTGETISAKRFFPAWLLNESDELIQKALMGLKGAGLETQISHFAFCTNGSHFCGEAGIPTIGFGPSREDLAHVIDEYIEIEQLTEACKGFGGIIKKLLA